MSWLFPNPLSLFLSEYSLQKLKDFMIEVRNEFCVRNLDGQLRNIPQSQPYKLNIGCGKSTKKDWINIDLRPPAEVTLDVRRGLPFPDNSCDIIYSEHFLEHLAYPNESVPFLRECLRVLRKGGTMHVGVPDSRYVVESCIQRPISPEFLEKAEKHNWGYPEYCVTGFDYINYHFRLKGEHKFAYDFETLRAHVEKVGFVNVMKRDFDDAMDSVSRAEGTLYVIAEKQQQHGFDKELDLSTRGLEGARKAAEKGTQLRAVACAHMRKADPKESRGEL